jgi:hypothetical protein
MLWCLLSSLRILVTHRRTGPLTPPESNTDRLPERGAPISSVCVESVRASRAAELGFRRAARFKSSIQSPCLLAWISVHGHASGRASMGLVHMRRLKTTCARHGQNRIDPGLKAGLYGGELKVGE